ncbi:MAG: anthranilate phosphoribosyltransferase [Candidatus Omnitrophica bacterium]|nr:anthranilate phosphoribosyltransferase [Candidatus Omnitrophota bacterium]HOX53876.1 anthranilate phosphoribosyltransferase [Candidatus Omnitrophota bacterium]
MIEEAIIKLSKRINLTGQEMQQVMQEIMTGKVADDKIATFLSELRQKGETPEEITAAATIMRKFAIKIKSNEEIILDTCGTGGDKSGTFNISTISAFVVAASGIAVAKHGNRSVSSKCGSADLLEALGVNINIPPEAVEECLAKIGIGFLFAPKLHPAMKYAMPARQQLKSRTIFNILGPLTNPAQAAHQVLGVFDKDLVEPLAQVLRNLGVKHALVVHGLDGLDEVTTTANTMVCEVKDKKIFSYEINPSDFGIEKASSEDLKGADIQTNVEIAKEVLSGKKGPERDIVLLNSACAIYAADKAGDIKIALKLAEKAIDSGKAKEKLALLIECTRKIG